MNWIERQRLSVLKTVYGGLAVALLLLMLVACSTAPEKTMQTTNPDLSVDVVGKVDGCVIYRFRDGGKTHYFVRCQGTPDVASMTEQSCGKNCTYSDDIRTVEKR